MAVDPNSPLNRFTLPSLYQKVLVTQEEARALFHRHNLPYIHPDIEIHPQKESLSKSSSFLIERAASRAIVRGALGGALGYAGIALDHTTMALHFLRLGQRLVALYGIDPQTEKGEALVLKALANSFSFKLNEYELPRELTELSYFIQQVQSKTNKSASASKFVAKSAFRFVLKRHFKRIFPIVGMTMGAVQARHALFHHGHQMQIYIAEKLYQTHTPSLMVEAIEIQSI